MRRTTILLVLAISSELLLACAGADRHPPGTHSATAASSGTTTGGSPAKSQALAFARAANLTARDLPGFTASSPHRSETSRERNLEHDMLRCAGSLRSGEGLAEASSKDFELRRGIVAVSVSSDVSVAQTPAIAASGLAAVRSAHVRGCFSRYLGLLLKGQHYGEATVGPVSIQSGTPPAPGTTGGFGWRVTATLTTHRIRIPFYMDILGFVYGPARVTLFSSGALQPFPAAAEQRLFSLLLHRAKAHVP
jgi:hypothetical protein